MTEHKTTEMLIAENARMRAAILILSDVLDEIILLLPTQPEIQERLREANAAVKRSL